MPKRLEHKTRYDYRFNVFADVTQNNPHFGNGDEPQFRQIRYYVGGANTRPEAEKIVRDSDSIMRVLSGGLRGGLRGVLVFGPSTRCLAFVIWEDAETKGGAPYERHDPNHSGPVTVWEPA